MERASRGHDRVAGLAHSASRDDSVADPDDPRHRSPSAVEISQLYRHFSPPPSAGPLRSPSSGGTPHAGRGEDSLHFGNMSTSSRSGYSTDSATQHAADLQRQITLKTLTLQTLQSEYSSLLAKFHRERTRSQTIEKKAQAAEKEINTLTSQNEDLTDQASRLDEALTASDAKFDELRADFAREKKQFVSILGNGSKLMERYVADRRAWSKERAELQGPERRLREGHVDEAALLLGPADGLQSGAVEGDEAQDGVGGTAEKEQQLVQLGLRRKVLDLMDCNEGLTTELAALKEMYAAARARAQALVECLAGG